MTTIKTKQQLSEALRQQTEIYDEKTNEWWRDEDKAMELTMLYQNHVAQLQSVSAVYSKADSIIVGDNVSVSVDSEGKIDTPAYNDGREVIFNASLLESLDDETITSLHGFNYHEVAHLLFSPRQGSELGQWIRENNMRRAYNILEDSRIERLITTLYPTTRLYLEACITDYLLKGNSNEWHDYFYLTTGRKYLDLELRQELADRFISKHGEELAQTIARITHEYRSLSFPNDSDKAKELIAEYSKIVGQDSTETVFEDFGTGHDTRDIGKQGRPKSGKKQKELQDRANANEGKGGNGKDEELFDRNYSEGKTADDNNINEGDIEQSEQRADSDSEKALKDKLNEQYQKLLNNEQVKGGTAEIRNAIHSNSTQGSSVSQCSYKDEVVPMDSLIIAEQFAFELERLRIDNDPMWQLEQPQGRLNVARTIHADINDIDRLFDRWHIGNDNRDIEAVILMDNSGSMVGEMANALISTWSIKKAIETIDGRVTVFRFNYDSKLLYGSDDTAKPNSYRYIGSYGGTNPYDSLLEAQRILSNSDKGIKLLFTVSDGGWDYSDRCDEVVRQINQIEGALTVSVLLGNLSYYREVYGNERFENEIIPQYRHNCMVFHAVSEAKDLVGVARAVVAGAMGVTAR